MKILFFSLRQWSTRLPSRLGAAALVAWLSCQPAYADLPTVEPPSSGGGSGLTGQIKGYLQDGVVLGGLVLAAVAFIYVASAALATFAEVREGKSSWMTFAAIVVVGVVLLVAIIWLLGKSASIIL
ncbi:TIGR03745 family integrating conjugative element membrane protein [Serratia sp. JSRIV006]|uniref:TIGR03745 family integrating conjugative element membrane protein n=1 Tax=Serratia sp. JSRIV006 TaxID=2831896 RepID=UPI001CBB520E|nr:TIGR03745 family integrating conjugative element membrane protein [Serratia sp. JSRIV006]UAN63386.1 TIGR03745 family integrating conjugative element membrane protein [Serratia sp. JSRIV006]